MKIMNTVFFYPIPWYAKYPNYTAIYWLWWQLAFNENWEV